MARVGGLVLVDGELSSDVFLPCFCIAFFEELSLFGLLLTTAEGKALVDGANRARGRAKQIMLETYNIKQLIFRKDLWCRPRHLWWQLVISIAAVPDIVL